MDESQKQEIIRKAILKQNPDAREQECPVCHSKTALRLWNNNAGCEQCTVWDDEDMEMWIGAYGEQADKERCCYCGSTEHITKPTDKKLKCDIVVYPDIEHFSEDFFKIAGVEVAFQSENPATKHLKKDKPSMAIIAIGDKGSAIVDYIGYSIEDQVSHVGTDTYELGFEKTEGDENGIWVWEGDYKWTEGPYEYPLDGSYEPVGQYRAMTDKEWELFKKCLPIWDHKEWLIDTEEKR